MGKIVVIGSANADLVVQVDRRPIGGETVKGSDLVVVPGGKGANQAAAAAMLGGDVWFIGCVGRDTHGELLRNSLVHAGVNVSGIVEAETTPTGSAVVMLTPDGENSIVVMPGSNRLVNPEMLREAESVWADARLVVMQLEVPMESVEFMASECRRRGIRFLLNAGPAAPLKDEVLAACDPLVVNESEAAFLLGEPLSADPLDLAQRLLATGPKSLVLTLGSAGSLAVTSLGTIRQPAQRVRAVDTTGAGDAFVGGLATVLAAGGDLAAGLSLGTEAAAHAVQGMGAQASYATKAELERKKGEQR